MAFLDVTFTRCREGKPLATVHNMPGLDADMRPEQMRKLAEALLKAADYCDSRPMGKRSFIRHRLREFIAI